MQIGPSHPSRLLFASLACVALLLAASGCGDGGEEPSEVPASPPPGKGLPKFAHEPVPTPRAVG